MPSPMTAIRISVHLTAEGLGCGVDMLGHLVKLFRGQGLGAVGEGVLGIVVDLDDQAVGSGSHRGQGQRLYQPADTGGVAGIYDMDDYRRSRNPWMEVDGTVNAHLSGWAQNHRF